MYRTCTKFCVSVSTDDGESMEDSSTGTDEDYPNETEEES